VVIDVHARGTTGSYRTVRPATSAAHFVPGTQTHWHVIHRASGTVAGSNVKRENRKYSFAFSTEAKEILVFFGCLVHPRRVDRST
jgi:hypothetical protein